MHQSDPPKSPPHHVNDDRSPLINLMTCIECKQSMKIEIITPDGYGNDLIKYRCKICLRTESLRLTRRTWG